MRVVGGKHKGLILAGPESGAVRPTSDRIREAVFNILAHGVEGFDVEGARVLDLFAGTGALGLEALSRGAGFCLFVERAADACALIRRNVEGMDAFDVSRIWRRDAVRLGRAQDMPPFSLAFADPPYGKGLGEEALSSAALNGWLDRAAICVLEETAKVRVDAPYGLSELDRRVYGDTQIVFMRRE